MVPDHTKRQETEAMYAVRMPNASGDSLELEKEVKQESKRIERKDAAGEHMLVPELSDEY